MRRSGSVFRPVYKDRHGHLKKARTFWVQYHNLSGRRVREATEAKTAKEAEKILRERQERVAAGKPVQASFEAVTLADLYKMVVNDYAEKKRRSAKRVAQAWAHLKDFFGEETKAVTITEVRVDQYKAHRRSEQATTGTLRIELALVRRMYRLAAKKKVIPFDAAPSITLPAAPEARSGFMTDSEIDALVDVMPGYLKPAVKALALTGWRTSEILSREWRHVSGDWLILDPGEGKTRQARQFPLVGEIREVIKAQREYTDAIERSAGKVIPYVFHHNGKRIGSFRKTWMTACVQIGLGHEVRDKDGRLVEKIATRTPHDLRRSAARRLVLAGVAQKAAMDLMGHKTASIFNRYAITDSEVALDAVRKLTAYRIEQKARAEREADQKGTVSTMPRKTQSKTRSKTGTLTKERGAVGC